MSGFDHPKGENILCLIVLANIFPLIAYISYYNLPSSWGAPPPKSVPSSMLLVIFEKYFLPLINYICQKISNELLKNAFQSSDIILL